MIVLNRNEGTKLEELEAMVAQAKEGVKYIETGANLLAIAVHRIYTEQLYLAELDDRGLPLFPNQTAYEPELLQALNISRATLYNHYTPIRVACGDTFKLDYQGFINTGGKVAWSVATKEFLNYDDTTGTVTSLADGRPLEAQKLVDKLEEMAKPGPNELMLRPALVRQELADVLGFERTYQEPIRYELVANRIKGWITTGQYVVVENFNQLPDEIQRDILRRLGVKQ